jgi:hypothetical protein
VNASKTPQPHISQGKLYRDSIGRERTEEFYDDGRLGYVIIRDPRGNSTYPKVVLNVVKKTASVYSTSRSFSPQPGKGWSVQQLEPRVIAGFSAEGLRFTRPIPTVIIRVPYAMYETVMEEYWISNELGVVLEQTSDNPLSGKTTMTVIRLQRVEPDPALFVIPSGYSLQQFTRLPD